jgi:hypothetical protein
MNKMIMALFLLVQSNITSAKDLNPLLEMRPGEAVKSKIRLNGSNKNFSYEIEEPKISSLKQKSYAANFTN